MLATLLSVIPGIAGLILAASTGTDAAPWAIGGLITPAAVAGMFLTRIVVLGKTYEDTVRRYEADLARERTEKEAAQERERKLRDATEERIIPAQVRQMELQQRSSEVLEKVLIALAQGEK